MTQDLILEAIERKNRKTALKAFVENPMRAIDERPYLIYVIAGVLSAVFAGILLYFHVEMSQVIVLTLVVAFLPPGYYDYHKRGDARKKEAEFPALLRDISLSVKSGMTLKGALAVTALGEYGALTSELKHIDSLMSWGVSFEDSMLYLAKKYPTSLIRRSVSTIIEASASGGEIGPIMESVANDAEETKALERKRSGETQPYLIVCYMSFLVFMAVIIIVSRYFIDMMAQMLAETKVEELGGIQFKVSADDLAGYNTLFFHALVIQGVCAGLVTGKISEGTVLAGIKHSTVFVVIGTIFYKLLT